MPSKTISSILVVDDQPDNLRTLSAMLKREGYTVRQAINGKVALNTVQAIAPDIILLDIRMPDMDGYEVCTQLKANPSTFPIPVIFLSALDDAMDKAKAFSVGGDDYITKPFQSEEVLVRIQHQITIQSQQQQLLGLNQQLQTLNLRLERQVKARTLELQQALTFEQTLKRISDQVRDTLDQNQILQSAVIELATALECHGCNAVVYSPDHLTSTIRYQYVQSGIPATQGQLLPRTDIPEFCEQLHQKYWFAFCQIQPSPLGNHSAILACPIFNDQVEEQGILGELWLFKSPISSFSEREVHLVEQAANQCAIALRQAQLYEAAQQQVHELERLNRLKDDFLSTISHELRTPLATMTLSLAVLDKFIDSDDTPNDTPDDTPASPASAPGRIRQYLEILKQECDRELLLVQDLLDLQNLEADLPRGELNGLTTVNLSNWLHHIVEVFEVKAHEQQQHLELDIPTDLPPFTIDLPSLSRIMTELLTNACKYTPAHETINVSATHESPNICIHVINTGVEIAPEELPRIFDKFYRIPNNDPWKYSGTGLGLALVKRLVEKMGGAIAVTSKNQSVCFIIRLPV